jgi:alpha-L-fucosidase
MGMRRRSLLAAAATAAMLDVDATGIAEAATDAGSPDTSSADPVPVPISALYNNNGIGVAAGDANIDGSGYGFPAAGLPSGTVTVNGVPYDLPANTAAGQNDNVVALGQTITVPTGRYQTAYLLATSTYGASGGTATVHYADGSTSTAQVSAPDWYSVGALTASYRYSPSGIDQHPVGLYPVQVWLDPDRTATVITLPTTSAPSAGVSSLHVFALSLQPVVTGYAVRIMNAASTTKQLSPGGNRAQVVQATVVNVGSEWITPQRPLTVTVSANGYVPCCRPASLNWPRARRRGWRSASPRRRCPPASR